MLGFQFLSGHCGFSVEMAGGIMARVLQLDCQGLRNYEMMKLGGMSLSYKDQFRDAKIDLEAFIDKAYGMCLDGIDLHTRAFASTEPDYLRDIRMRSLRRG